MNNPLEKKSARQHEIRYDNRDVWRTENLKFAEAHFRMEKVARVVRRLASAQECELLDLGCGPAALARLLPDNVHYHGIDIAIQEPAPNLIEMDILQQPISFQSKKFDIIVAQGLLEYFGDHQSQKFTEIRSLLKENGKFIATYTNFAHRSKEIYWLCSNVQAPADFRRDLNRYFVVERSFPSAHNWNPSIPSRKLMKAAQAHLNVEIPVLSPLLAVDRIYICSALPDGRKATSGAPASSPVRPRRGRL
jgi:cyclopropane fatty-acyl-phospholipid synthase-like methyltransferase